MTVSKDFEELFAALRSAKVKFVIVGGYAVAFHAKPRFTKDIDVLVEPTGENAERLVTALSRFGFGSLGLGVEDFTREGVIIQLGVPPNRVDLLTSITGVGFDDVWANRVGGRYGEQAVDYIGLRELIKNKEAAGRPQDLIDVGLLRRVQSR